MTDGSNQGLFIVVAVVIFGIFVAIAYTLFEDTLSPSLASMFSDTIETASNRLDSRKILIGKWDWEVDAHNDIFENEEGKEEFVQYGVDMAPIFDEHGLGKYILEFEMRATNPGSVWVFMQNNNSFKYTWGTRIVEAETTFQKYSLEVDVKIAEQYTTNRSELAFHGDSYDTDRHPTVKKVRLYKIIE